MSRYSSSAKALTKLVLLCFGCLYYPMVSKQLEGLCNGTMTYFEYQLHMSNILLHKKEELTGK